MPDRKKILMVATGGTIASMDEGQGLTPKLTTEEILSTIPEVKDICRIEALQLMKDKPADLIKPIIIPD